MRIGLSGLVGAASAGAALARFAASKGEKGAQSSSMRGPPALLLNQKAETGVNGPVASHMRRTIVFVSETASDALKRVQSAASRALGRPNID